MIHDAEGIEEADSKNRDVYSDRFHSRVFLLYVSGGDAAWVSAS